MNEPEYEMAYKLNLICAPFFFANPHKMAPALRMILIGKRPIRNIRKGENKMRKWMKKLVVVTMVLTLILGGASSAFAKGKGNDRDHDERENEWEIEWEDDEDEDEGKFEFKAKGKQNVDVKLKFEDMERLDWALKHVASLASKRVFEGYDDGTFRPNKPITRLEAVITAVRLMGLREEAETAENMTATLNFSDADKIVRKYPQAVGYVAVAMENDLFLETERKLNPKEAASRLWATILLIKSLGLEEEVKAKMNTQLTFKDAEEIPAGAVGYVAVAVEKKIVSGYENNTFRPNKPITRAELAVLLDRTGNEMPDYGSGAIVGTVGAEVGSNLILALQSGGEAVQLAIDPNAFVYRDGAKISLSQLKVGDEVKVRTYNNVVIFIEVLESIENQNFTVSGKFVSRTLNNQGQMNSVTILLNGNTELKTYAVVSDVNIEGNLQQLVAGQDITLSGKNQQVSKIEIIDEQNAPFTVQGAFLGKATNSNGQITAVTLNVYGDNGTHYATYPVDANVTIVGDAALLVPGQNVKVSGENQTVKKIEILNTNLSFVVEGTYHGITLNTQGKISTIAINRTVNGSSQVSIYPVAADVTIVGDTAQLAENRALELRGSNQTVNTIIIK
jgi:hypothetical protein